MGERAGAVGLMVIKMSAVRHAHASAGSSRLSPVQRWKTYASRRFFRNCQAHCGAVTITSSRPETGRAEKCGPDRALCTRRRACTTQFKALQELPLGAGFHLSHREPGHSAVLHM